MSDDLNNLQSGDGDFAAFELRRSCNSQQLTQKLGQTALGAATGSSAQCKIPINANRCRIWVTNVGGAATFNVRGQVQQPSNPLTPIRAVLMSVALGANASTTQSFEVPPDGGVLSAFVTGMPPLTAVAMSAVIQFWREG